MSVAPSTRSLFALQRGILRVAVMVVLTGLLFSAENYQERSNSSTAPANLDSGLNRLREKKSGPAGDQGSGGIDDPAKKTKPAAPSVSPAPLPVPPAAVAKPAPVPAAIQSREPASAPVVAPVAEAGSGLRPRDIQFGVAGLLLLVGFWILWSQENYRSDAEELIKDNKISPDRASRLVANRKLGGNAAIIGGFFLFLYAIM